MRIRQILLAHTSRAFRGLIKKYLFSELSDTEITGAGSTEEALRLINSRSFDLILASSSLHDLPVAEFMARIGRSELNDDTPFIVLAENDDDQGYADLIRKGFEHVVHIRLRPGDLIKKINKVCNPREWRKDERYHIPNGTVQIQGNTPDSEATLINISEGGVLVEMITHAPEMLMQGMLRLTLNVVSARKPHTVSGLTCKLSRLHVIKWHSDHSPVIIRATFVFTDLDQKIRAQLNQILQMAKEGRLADQCEETPPAEKGRVLKFRSSTG